MQPREIIVAAALRQIVPGNPKPSVDRLFSPASGLPRAFGGRILSGRIFRGHERHRHAAGCLQKIAPASPCRFIMFCHGFTSKSYVFRPARSLAPPCRALFRLYPWCGHYHKDAAAVTPPDSRVPAPSHFQPSRPLGWKRSVGSGLSLRAVWLDGCLSGPQCFRTGRPRRKESFRSLILTQALTVIYLADTELHD